MFRRPAVRWTTMCVLACILSVLGNGAGRGQQTNVEKQLLAYIKAKLPPNGDKATTWYVLRLETVTSSSSSTATGTTTRVRSSLRVVKIQGQDAAAQAVLEHLQSGPAGTKRFYTETFPNTATGIRQMEQWLRELDVLLKLNGFRDPSK